MTAVFLKRTLLAFWGVWLGESWRFASGNYAFLMATTARYSTLAWLNGRLFTAQRLTLLAVELIPEAER